MLIRPPIEIKADECPNHVYLILFGAQTKLIFLLTGKIRLSY